MCKTFIRANTDEGEKGGRGEAGSQQSECDVGLFSVKEQRKEGGSGKEAPARALGSLLAKAFC